ncbi:hypothetical protein CBM2615_A240218 [Cupriavidus taiwanensis]|nr:hypothetical protein CBM2615_A240218 [Cupriavidus taiwanensis]SOZ54024.1 hypothetical protein CBM2614_A210220 [Cupriavidus taiwanensis]SPA04779.1 hypothetical protein CBM2625_A170216 [Cupriavidus taiwanensis]
MDGLSIMKFTSIFLFQFSCI